VWTVCLVLVIVGGLAAGVEGGNGGPTVCPAQGAQVGGWVVCCVLVIVIMWLKGLRAGFYCGQPQATRRVGPRGFPGCTNWCVGDVLRL
jgi:hypothetical protein